MNQDFLLGHSLLMAQSFLKATNQPLSPFTDLSLLFGFLYNADFALLSHGTEEDPIFNYANRTAQKLWGMDWDEFTKLPSRLSAEPVSQEERNQLLLKAKEKGYIDDYSGIRISKNGSKFQIINTTLWNLIDENNIYKGQAAMIPKWKYI